MDTRTPCGKWKSRRNGSPLPQQPLEGRKKTTCVVVPGTVSKDWRTVYPDTEQSIQTQSSLSRHRAQYIQTQSTVYPDTEQYIQHRAVYPTHSSLFRHRAESIQTVENRIQTRGKSA
ncbi:hypothetical protein ACOMHN_020253 [Nucella lapillus]